MNSMTDSNPYLLNQKKTFSTHNVLLSQIGKNQTVLDVGCNEGYLGQISDKSCTFYGLDISENAVAKAKAVYKDAAVCNLDDCKKLPWDQKFDMIMLGDVLEHTKDPAKVLKNLVENYLKDSGSVVLSLPNVANWRIRLSLFFGNFDYTDTGILDRTHLRFFTFKTAQALVSRSNLSITKVRYGSSIFGHLIKLLPLSFVRNLFASSIIIVAKK